MAFDFSDIPVLIGADQRAQQRFARRHGPEFDDGQAYTIRLARDLELQLDSDYFIKQVWEANSVNMTYGPSGEGKTFVTADMVLHVASGRQWNGYRVRRGGVVYLAAESPTSVERRIVAMASELDLDRDAMPLAVLSGAFNLVRDPLAALAAVEKARDQLRREFKVDRTLLVIDTLARSAPGMDENASADMGAFIGFCDRVRYALGLAVVIVHHAGKDITRGARGHGSHKAAVDCELLVNEGEIVLQKLRDGKEGLAIPFRLRAIALGEDSDGDIRTTCVVTYETPHEQRDNRAQMRLSPSARIALDALKEAIGEHGRPTTATSVMPGGKQSCSMDEWRERFYSRTADREYQARKKSFQRTKDQLQAAKVIGSWESTVWLW